MTDNIKKALKVLSDFENRRVLENEVAVYKGYPTPEAKYFKLTRKMVWDLFNKYKPKGYIINERNEEVLYLLLRYFCEDPNFDKNKIVSNWESLDINKGILISGTFGIGKSILFETIQKMGKELAMDYGYMGLWFKSISAGAFVKTYMVEVKKDSSVFDLESYYSGKLYIDDLGIEGLAFNSEELFSTVLFERHRSKAKTFVTTNLKPSEITQRYGDRIGDRLGEMFNIINWSGESWR